MVVLVFGALRFPPEKFEQMKSPLRDFVEATIRLDGCIAFDVAEDVFDPGVLRFSEIWPNREVLEKHLQAPHIILWREVIAGIGLLSQAFSVFDSKDSPPV